MPSARLSQSAFCVAPRRLTTQQPARTDRSAPRRIQGLAHLGLHLELARGADAMALGVELDEDLPLAHAGHGAHAHLALAAHRDAAARRRAAVVHHVLYSHAARGASTISRMSSASSAARSLEPTGGEGWFGWWSEGWFDPVHLRACGGCAAGQPRSVAARRQRVPDPPQAGLDVAPFTPTQRQ